MNADMKRVLRHKAICPNDDVDDIARALGMHPDAVRMHLAMATKEQKDGMLKELVDRQKDERKRKATSRRRR